jgi:tripartite-type tricarboxylate transporter receptor subunit TctC
MKAAVRSTIRWVRLLVLLICGSAAAQDYPSGPISMIVPFGAGGPTDQLARLVADRMGSALNQSFVIVNVPGAAGTIGVGRVVRAAPDGNTIGIGHWSTNVLNGAIYQLPYDLVADLEPIALLPANPAFITVRKDLPANNVKELIAWLKASDGKATAGTAGSGAVSHVVGVYFQSITGTSFQFVPYRGGTGPAMTDLIAGHIDMIFDQASNSIAHVRAGNVRALAVTAKARLPAAPDVPSVDEAGVPGLYNSTWYGLWAPKGTPKDIVLKLNKAAVAALADLTLQERLRNEGFDMPAADQHAPEALAAYQKSEIEKWWPIIKAANIKAE